MNAPVGMKAAEMHYDIPGRQRASAIGRGMLDETDWTNAAKGLRAVNLRRYPHTDLRSSQLFTQPRR